MERNDWHLREVPDVLTELQTDMYTGLTTAEAVKRRKRRGRNRVWYIHRTTWREILFACVADLSAVLLVVTAVFAAIFEESRAALAIVGVLAVGMLLRMATYGKARRVLEDNAAEGIPTCAVLRDGKMTLLSAEELTYGDIVFLEGGDVVPADGRIVAGDDLAVSERGITANKETVRKFDTVIRTDEPGSAIPTEYRSNLLYAGSTVLWGQARMTVTGTGDESLIVRKQGGIRVRAGEKLPFEERLNGWCRNGSLTMLACVMVITALALFLGHDFAANFLTSMTLAVAAMSEYLTSIAYTVIAIAMQDTGKRDSGAVPEDTGKTKKKQRKRKAAVINDAASIGRIAGVDRLVLSDIRILKSGEMDLQGWFLRGEMHTFPAETEEAEEAWSENDRQLEELLRLSLATVGGKRLDTSLAGSAITAMPEKFTMLHRAADTYTKRTGRSVDFSFTALDRVEGRIGIAGGLDTVLLQEKGDIYAVVTGEIRQVMACCHAYEGPDGQTLPMDDAMRKAIFTEAAGQVYGGATVYACAKRTSPYTSLNRLSLLQSNMTFVGFVSMGEPAAHGVREAVTALREGDFSLMLLSEDPEKDLYYGREIGLFDKNTTLLTAENADKLPREGMVIVEMPTVRTAALSDNVSHSHTRYARLGAILDALSRGENESTEEEPKKHKKRAHGTAVLVRDVLDARLLTLGEVAVAVGDSDTRPVSQPLKAKADVIVYPEGGGFSEAVEAISQSRLALYHLWSCAMYLSTSQLSRMVLLAAAAIFDFAMPPAWTLLGVGLVLDFAAVLTMAFCKMPAFGTRSTGALTIPKKRMGLPGGIKSVLAIAGLGFLWGILQSAIPLVCGLLDTPYTGILLASILVSQLLLSGTIGQRGSFFKCHFHTAYILYAALVILLTIWSITTWPAVWYAYFFAFVPPVLLFAIWELTKLPRKSKARKEKNSSNS